MGGAIPKRRRHVGAERAASDAQDHTPAIVAVDPLAGQVYRHVGAIAEEGSDEQPRGGDGGVARWLVLERLAEERVARRLEHEAGGGVGAHRNYERGVRGKGVTVEAKYRGRLQTAPRRAAADVGGPHATCAKSGAASSGRRAGREGDG